MRMVFGCAKSKYRLQYRILRSHNKNFEVKSFPAQQSIYGFDILFKKGMIKLGADLRAGYYIVV